MSLPYRDALEGIHHMFGKTDDDVQGTWAYRS